MIEKKTIEKKATVADTLQLFKKIETGKFFSCEFRKVDGTIRNMTCRTHVKKFTNGGKLSFNPSQRGLLPVWDVQKKEYRFVNLNSLIWLRFEKVKYIF